MYLVLINIAFPEERSGKLASSCTIKEWTKGWIKLDSFIRSKKKIRQLEISPYPYLQSWGKAKTGGSQLPINRRERAAVGWVVSRALQNSTLRFLQNQHRNRLVRLMDPFSGFFRCVNEIRRIRGSHLYLNVVLSKYFLNYNIIIHMLIY